MYSSLRPFFQWVGSTWVSATISSSNWLFPAIEAVHIVALALLLGAIVMLNMRLLGLTMRTKPSGQLYAELAPWTFASLAVILTTGALLFSSEAMKAYGSDPFHVKMLLLAAAIAFHFTLYRRIAMLSSSWMSKPAACVSLVLWFGVGLAGRAIGFF
jgi:hypothetical protein